MNPLLLRSLKWIGLGLAGVLLLGIFALGCTYVYLSPSLSTAQNMHKVQMAVPLRVYARSGGLISQIGEERPGIRNDGEYRQPERMPSENSKFRQAFGPRRGNEFRVEHT